LQYYIEDEEDNVYIGSLLQNTFSPNGD